MFKFLIFDEESIEKIRKIRKEIIVLSFIFLIIVHSLPSSFKSFEEYLINFITNLIIVLISSILLIGLLYLISKFLGSNLSFSEFSSIFYCFAIITLVSIVLAFLLIQIGILTNTYDMFLSAVQGGFVLYYLFIVFGWCSERIAKLDGMKGIVFGLISITGIYLYHIVLSFLQ